MMATLKYQVVNATALAYRNAPTLKGEPAGYLKQGEYILVESEWSKEVDGVVWFKMTNKEKDYYVSSKYLKRISPNYRALVSENVKKVYETIVNIGCKHKGGAKSFSQIKSKKITTCASSVSAVLQESGMMAKGKLLSHTKAVGSSKAVKKKNSKSKAISGLGNLKAGTYNIYKVGKVWKHVPSKYKVSGAIAIYDSNVAIYRGDGVFYTTNNGASQKKNGKYKNVTAKSGYCFTSPVLYIIIPKA